MSTLRPVLFFRKPFAASHSIEELFSNILANLPPDIEPDEKMLPRTSRGFVNRIYNMLWAARKQGTLNHITGDVHYIALFLRKRKTILTIHDLEILKRSHGLSRMILRRLWFTMPCRRVRLITVISGFTKEELLREVRIVPEKIRVIPNCITPLPYRPKPFAKACPMLLQVGTKQNKNLTNLILALKDIPCTLTILGQTTATQKALLSEHHINYTEVSGLSYEQVKDLYHACDLLVYVSTYEGFGLPILEAQSAGRVVITSNIASMPFVAGQGALLTDPFDVQSIHQAIQTLIHDDTLRESLIARGRENVKRFLPETVAGMYEQLYHEIITNDR